MRTVTLAGACLWPTLAVAEAPTPLAQSAHFAIDAGQLSPALLQFSHQSGIAIVFSDHLTRNLQAPPVNGNLRYDAALSELLAGSGLAWTLVNQRIVAIYSPQCGGEAGCDDAEATLSRYPVYSPGIEETYVYGSRVTGSRIRRTGYQGAAPVDVFSAPDIELSGAQTLGDLLKFVPAVAGNATSTAISNGGDGTATVTLRGLPASNTLVLINGRRVANDGLAGESVDLNSIPPAAVERIEILKDSASAIYGSDAIAGVVNVIMKQDFHGFLAETFYGQAEQGDLDTQTHTFQYGTGFNNGSLFLSGSYYDQGAIYSRDRRVSRSADTRALGGTDQRSSATPDARVTLADDRTLIADGDGYRPAGDDDFYNYQQHTTAVVPLKRASLYGNASYDFNEQVTGLVELSYLETKADARLAPTPVFTAFEQMPLTVAADNIYNSFDEDIEDVRRRLVEMPARRQHNDAEVMRFSAIMEGLYDDWNWDVGYTWSRSEASETYDNLVNANHLARGLGPADQCQGPPVDNCVPINLLGSAGSLSEEQVAYLTASDKVSGYSKLSSISANFSNALLELPAGRGDIAFGLEYRQEATAKRTGPLLASGATLGATNQQATSGERQITELYIESILPLWRAANGLAHFTAEAAIRYSDYSDFGDSTNPKLGLRWQINPGLALRATFAEGFRAPSLNELYSGQTEEQAFIDDPCTQADNVGVLPGCTVQADPSRNQFLVVRGGNENLRAETAFSAGAGITWSPQAVPGLKMSVDYFAIEQENVVDSSAQFVVNQNARRLAFADNVSRDANGNLTLITANNINIGEREVKGVDLAVVYHYPRRRYGQFTLSGSATYLAQYAARLDATAPEIDLAGTFRDEASEGLGGIPEWKGQLGLRWNKERWLGSYEIHYVSAMDERLPGTDEERRIDDWLIHDLQLSYKFDVLDGLRWTLGLDNAFNEPAPLAASGFNDNIDGRTHELRGRYWYTKLSQRF